jgi:type I restriction enzyme M protein
MWAGENMTERNIIPRVREQLEELGYSRNSIVEQFEFSPGILADLAVLNENGKPRIIAEIKTTIHLPLGRNQLERYLKKSRADYGLLTDGNVGYYYARLGSDEIIEITRLPRNGEALNSISKTPLKPLTDFSYKFWKIFDVLRGELPLDVQFKEFLKIILCKYVDELDDRNAPTFVVSDPSLSGWQETTKNRIETLFENTKQRYPDLFRATEKLELSARAISYIVGEMQNYCVACDPAALSFAMTELQKRIVRSAENSTPAQLVKLVIEMLTPNENDTVLDLACGYGNFLSGLLHYTMERQPPDSQLASSLASNIFGIEINSNVALFAKANMILYGVGGENILVGDALSELPYSPRLHEILKQGGFDLVFVDPPLLGRTTPNKYAMD